MSDVEQFEQIHSGATRHRPERLGTEQPCCLPGIHHNCIVDRSILHPQLVLGQKQALVGNLLSVVISQYIHICSYRTTRFISAQYINTVLFGTSWEGRGGGGVRNSYFWPTFVSKHSINLSHVSIQLNSSQ